MFIVCILKKFVLDEEDINEDLNNVIVVYDEEFIGKDNGIIILFKFLFVFFLFKVGFFRI